MTHAKQEFSLVLPLSLWPVLHSNHVNSADKTKFLCLYIFSFSYHWVAFDSQLLSHFPLRFTVLYPLVFRYFFSVSITLFYCFHFIFPSFFFFHFFLFNTPSIPFFNHPHFSSVIRRYPAPDLLTPLNVYGCHGCLNMQISKSLVRDMFAWPDNLTWSHISCR